MLSGIENVRLRREDEDKGDGVASFGAKAQSAALTLYKTE